MMKVVFVGHFSPLPQEHEQASSAAGNQVQRQIFKDLLHQSGTNLSCNAMTPQPCWPRGPLVVREKIEGLTTFLGYLNLPVLKHIVFAFRLFARLLMIRPQLCLQYNSYLFENLALLLYRLYDRGCVLAVIIQDIHASTGVSFLSKRGLRSLGEQISLRLAKRFNMIIPISSAIISDFNFAPSKCFIFQGGITEFAVQLMNGHERVFQEIGVFAGSLEPHNGIDRLVDQWIASGITSPLHVFGRGSLAKHVEQAARKSDRIVYHGHQPEDVVLAWQQQARWNFCLRYSIGLNQNYFFPSKLFNILCAPGATVVNDFHGIPRSLRNHLCIVADDLADIAERLPAAIALASSDRVDARRAVVQTEHSWKWCIHQIINNINRI